MAAFQGILVLLGTQNFPEPLSQHSQEDRGSKVGAVSDSSVPNSRLSAPGGTGGVV